MGGIPAFPKIWTLGMKETDGLYDDVVEVTEKLDGSQFSFGVIDGTLHMRSKGAVVYQGTAPKMFQKIVDYVEQLAAQDKLMPNWVYHGEWFDRPKHNTLEYGRTPKNGFALFGMRKVPETEFINDHKTLTYEAGCIDVDVVPLVYHGPIVREEVMDKVAKWIDTESYLGNVHMEGVVLKNYTSTMLVGNQYIPLCAAKFVSEKFKEKHTKSWPQANKAPIHTISEAYRSEARWHKAIQALRDNDTLEGSPRDIGALLKYIHQDISEECKEEIKDMLWSAYRKEILRASVRGFPEWYKLKLVEGIDL